MLVILEFFSAAGWGHLVYALAHTLWQGLLLSLLLRAALNRLPASRSDARYLAGLAALAGVLILGLLTWSVLEYTPRPPATDSAMAGPASATGDVSPAAAAADTEPGDSSSLAAPPTFPGPLSLTWTAWAGALWFAGAIAMLLRAGWLVAGAGRVRRLCKPLRDEAVEACVAGLCRAFRIARRVRVLVGDSIAMPAVMGVLWPTILLPASALTGLPPEHLRAILAHELAHIRRWDYLVNLFQMVVEAVLYFNPAVWWISRQVGIEREACCDALAIAATGDKVEYARTLAASARHFGLSRRDLRPAQAFGDSPRPSGVLDRAKRLLTPGHRPVMRLSWYSLAAVFVASGLALLALYHCSGLAVGFAAEVLTPEEKIERIVELSESHAPVTRQEYGEEDKITVCGVVRTEDGVPLPETLYMHADIRAPRSGIATGFRAHDGRFSERIEYGTVCLAVDAPGYAPAFAGPLRTEPGGTIDGIELVLTKGFPASVKLVDDAGQPVVGAKVTGGFGYKDALSSRTVNEPSDEDGLIRIGHAIADWPLSLTCGKDGFQDAKRDDIYLKPNGVYAWVLAKATPVTGVVTSAETGEPIGGAQVRLVFEQYSPDYGGMNYSIEDAPAKATTDGEGRFRLTRLRDGSTYHYYVDAVGYGPEWLLGVTSGSGELAVRLGSPRHIRGVVTGALEHLAQNRKSRGETEEYPVVYYTQDWTIGSHGNGGPSQEVPVEIREGVGRFDIPDVLPGEVTITAGGKSVQLNAQDSVDDLVIDLQEDSEPARRPVVFHLDVPPGSPPPKGGLAVRVLHLGPPRSYPMPEHFPVQDDGTVRVEVPLPGDGGLGGVMVESHGLIGYWAKRPGRLGHLDVPAGEGPMEVRLELHPAGAIYGEVLDVDGTLAEEASVSLVVDRTRSQLPEYDAFQMSDVGDYLGGEGSGKFNLTPLPFDCTYRLVACRGRNYVMSEPLRLTARRPVHRTTLQLAKGVTVHGRILDPSGAPLTGASVQLGYATPYSHGFGGTPVITDGEGRFTFDDINPDAPGTYRIELTFTRDYQSVSKEIAVDGKAVTIQLKQGLTIAGVVLDDQNGWPIPGARVRAHARDLAGGGVVFAEVEGLANERGEFRFSTLGDNDYWFQVLGANAVGNTDPSYRPGRDELVTLRVTVPEWSDLAPRKPAE